MIRISELHRKDVIDSNGKRLGFIRDIEINVERGDVEAIILPGAGRTFSLFGKNEDIVLPWSKIKKIGVDVILINMEPTTPENLTTATPQEVLWHDTEDEDDFFSV